jgi:enterochelin esterase-like enzyme
MPKSQPSANSGFTRRGYRRGVMLLAALAASAALLPGFTPTATGPDGGQVWSGTFPGAARAGFVYLPPAFDTSKRYPVVYLLHGMPGSPSEYLDGTDLAAFADAGISSGALRPFIAVGPAAGTSRAYNGEWAGPWERELVGQLVPWVDEHLPTVGTRAGRVIAGLSAGGYGAADIGIRNARLFGAIESWSGYFRPLDDGPFKDATRAVLAANDPQSLVQLDARALVGTRFFLSSGPYHSHWFRPEETVAFAREAHRAGLRVTLRLYSMTKGEWRAQFDDGLRWAFGRSTSRR